MDDLVDDKEEIISSLNENDSERNQDEFSTIVHKRSESFKTELENKVFNTFNTYNRISTLIMDRRDSTPGLSRKQSIREYGYSD